MFDLIPRALSEWDEWMSAPFWVQLLLCVAFDLIKKETTPCNCFLSLSFSHSNYQQIQHLGYAGHEIATESISQQLGLQDKGYEEWVGEMIGMREILRHFANVSVNDVVGMRAPFLKPGRNTQYKVSTETPTQILYMYTPHMEKNCSKCCANWLAIIVAALELFLRIE